MFPADRQIDMNNFIVESEGGEIRQRVTQDASLQQGEDLNVLASNLQQKTLISMNFCGEDIVDNFLAVDIQYIINGERIVLDKILLDSEVFNQTINGAGQIFIAFSNT